MLDDTRCASELTCAHNAQCRRLDLLYCYQIIQVTTKGIKPTPRYGNCLSIANGHKLPQFDTRLVSYQDKQPLGLHVQWWRIPTTLSNDCMSSLTLRASCAVLTWDFLCLACKYIETCWLNFVFLFMAGSIEIRNSQAVDRADMQLIHSHVNGMMKRIVQKLMLLDCWLADSTLLKVYVLLPELHLRTTHLLATHCNANKLCFSVCVHDKDTHHKQRHLPPLSSSYEVLVHT